MKNFMMEKHPDDTDSLISLVTIYDGLLLSFGLDEEDLGDHIDDHKSIKHHRYTSYGDFEIHMYICESPFIS